MLRGKSYVEYLLGQGFDVYMIDWGVPDDADRTLTLEDYIDGYLANCAAEVMKHARAKKVSMVGYCMGGTMSLLFTARHRSVVKNLVLLATPVDFHNDSLLSHWSKPANFDVDKFVDRHGNAPVEILQNTFQMLRPTKNITKYADLLEYADNEEYVNTFHAFDYWGNDAVPVAGETFRKFIKDTYQENLLARNQMRLGGNRIDLGQIKCPVLNVLAEHDPIVPPQSAEVLMNLIGSRDKELLKVKGGHHGISVGAGALKIVYPKSAEWLHKRSGNFRRVGDNS